MDQRHCRCGAAAQGWRPQLIARVRAATLRQIAITGGCFRPNSIGQITVEPAWERWFGDLSPTSVQEAGPSPRRSASCGPRRCTSPRPTAITTRRTTRRPTSRLGVSAATCCTSGLSTCAGERSGICSGVSTRRANKKGSDKGAFVLWRLCSLYYLQQVRPLS